MLLKDYYYLDTNFFSVNVPKAKRILGDLQEKEIIDIIEKNFKHFQEKQELLFLVYSLMYCLLYMNMNKEQGRKRFKDILLYHFENYNLYSQEEIDEAIINEFKKIKQNKKGKK